MSDKPKPETASPAEGEHIELDEVQLDAAVGGVTATSGGLIVPCVKTIIPCIKVARPG